jgi:hypothetical protein
VRLQAIGRPSAAPRREPQLRQDAERLDHRLSHGAGRDHRGERAQRGEPASSSPFWTASESTVLRPKRLAEPQGGDAVARQPQRPCERARPQLADKVQGGLVRRFVSERGRVFAAILTRRGAGAA